jgi:hypothetical protein
VLPPGSRVGAFCSVGSGLIVRRRDNPRGAGPDLRIGDRVAGLSGCRRFDDASIARLEASRWWERDIAALLADPPAPLRFVPDDPGTRSPAALPPDRAS